MNRFFAVLILLFGVCLTPVYANPDPETDTDSEEIIFNPDNGATTGKPKKPVFCPVKGYLTENVITLFSSVSGEAEITLIDKTGMSVFYDYAELYEGYTIILDEEIDYDLILITIGNLSFKAAL